MTGREVITYILENNLENEEFFVNGKLPGLITMDDAAVKLDCGSPCVVAYVMMGKLKTFRIGEEYYILESSLNELKKG